MTVQIDPQEPFHPDLPSLSAAPAPDRWLGFVEDGQQTARAALWFSGDTAVVGHFDALTLSAGTAVLQAATMEAQKQGVSRLVGPMNGNTWFKYRLVSDFGDHKPFFGEVWTSAQDLQCFLDAGFEPRWHYHSSITDHLKPDPRFADLQSKFAALGVEVRGVVPEKLDQDLSRIHQLSQVAFQNNPFFSPLPEGAFRQMYLPVFEQLPTQLILLAEHQDRLVGYLLAYPDPLNPGQAIVKTLAVDGARTYAGLGRYLTQLVQQQAFALGFRQIVHALMFDSNASRNLSHLLGTTVMRRYVLLEKTW